MNHFPAGGGYAVFIPMFFLLLIWDVFLSPWDFYRPSVSTLFHIYGQWMASPNSVWGMCTITNNNSFSLPFFNNSYAVLWGSVKHTSADRAETKWEVFDRERRAECGVKGRERAEKQQSSDSWVPQHTGEEVGGGEDSEWGGEWATKRKRKRNGGWWPVWAVTELPKAPG